MPKTPLEIAKEVLAQAIETKKQSKSILAQVGTAVIEMLKPFLEKLSADQQQSNDDLLNEIRNIEITVTPELKASEVTVNVPEIKVPAPQVTVNVPPIEVPEAKVTVKIPPIKVPKPEVTVNIPKFDLPQFPEEMEVKGWLKMQGFDNGLLSNPLPVQIRSADGTPVNWGALFGGAGSGGNGPRRVKIDNTASEPIPITGTISATFSADFGQGETGAETLRTVAATDSVQSVNVTGAFGSTVATGLINADNRLRVSLETGGSGLTDAELRATAVPVSQVSGAIDSVYVTGAAASTFAEIMNPDGRVKVELPTGSSGLTDTELRATAVPVSQLSGAAWSVFATNPAGNGDEATALRVVIAGNSSASVVATATDFDIRDLTQASDSVRVYQVSDGNYSVNVTNTVTVTGSLTSVVAVGAVVADAVDDGSAPVQIGGTARAANPTKVAGNDVVKASFDTIGRQIMRPVQVRGLIATAYISLSNGTETTLLAASAGVFHDCISVVGANTSSAAAVVHLRAVTGGNIVASFEIPSGGTAGVSFPVPYPQDETGNNWTADMDDITGTTVYLTGLFSKEV